MSRKYMLDRWCVRCHKSEPTPYLRDKVGLLIDNRHVSVLNLLDLGCGNGRNSDFLISKGFHRCNTTRLDMNPTVERVTEHHLGIDDIPLPSRSQDVILANYCVMFLSPFERELLYGEIDRVAKFWCRLMIETYPAKDSHCKTEIAADRFVGGAIRSLRTTGWDVVHRVKCRAILEKCP